MSKFEIKCGDSNPFVAGLVEGEDAFFITIHVGSSSDPMCKPRISVSSHGGEEGESVFRKIWLDEEIDSSTPVSIRMVDIAHLDSPVAFDQRPWPENFCCFCEKTASEVDCLIKSPDKLAAICMNCVAMCGERAEEECMPGCG